MEVKKLKYKLKKAREYLKTALEILDEKGIFNICGFDLTITKYMDMTINIDYYITPELLQHSIFDYYEDGLIKILPLIQHEMYLTIIEEIRFINSYLNIIDDLSL